VCLIVGVVPSDIPNIDYSELASKVFVLRVFPIGTVFAPCAHAHIRMRLLYIIIYYIYIYIYYIIIFIDYILLYL